MLNTKEHYDLLDAFERNHRDLRLDRENRALWAKGRIYQSGETNSLFLAFRRGYALGKVITEAEALGYASDKADLEADNKWLRAERDALAAEVERLRNERAAREKAEAQLAEARKALDLFEHYGCPICHGDCSSANPPVDCCPMEAARRVREGGDRHGE